jgi:hypothetical protein
MVVKKKQLEDDLAYETLKNQELARQQQGENSVNRSSFLNRK